TVGRARPVVRRQLLTALRMDADDLRFTGDRSDPVFDGVPCSDPAEVVAEYDFSSGGMRVPAGTG
ncbi:MAG TPA: hypothetical protein VGO26_05300, partial [Amnibacterium sp.]|nr:hypothetical protein [Amnibacterium sp.]